jgi:predicted nicotinamide N-methyase
MLRHDPSLDVPVQQDLAPWVIAMVNFIDAETRLVPLPYVPEITLRLAVESVPLWDKIERELKLRGGPPYWAFAWAGGLALARHLVDHPSLVNGRRVLDFAAGSGLAAIAAAKGGAAHVLASDIDPLAVIAISLNAQANGVEVEANANDLLSPDSTFDPADVDVVLVGDVFYERSLAARSMAFLERCRAAGCVVLIGDPGRAELPLDRLTKISSQAVSVTRDCQYLAAPSGKDGPADLRAAAVWTLDPPAVAADESLPADVESPTPVSPGLHALFRDHR